MTFSLLAFDDKNQSLGICSITSSPAHGQRCPHLKKGVGVITTQGMSNRFHGETAIKLLEAGFSPEQCIQTTKGLDVNIECRQIAIIDAQGRKAAFTGGKTKDFHGHLIGEQYIAAGNYLASEKVIESMVDGFLSSSGELADRLLSGCIAGQSAGGERGGAYSGFLIVVRPDQMQPWGAHVDIRIDFSRDLIQSMTDALSEYRRWERDRLDDRLYTLDDSVPVSLLITPK